MDRQDQGEATAEDKTGPLALLPDDVLADVLRRLPPRGLAASRCVCKAWLAVVDARRLLRADLLPLTLGAFFMNFYNYYISELFAPQPVSDGPSISGKHDYLPEAGCLSWGYVDDHCNGLVLVHNYPNSDWYGPLPGPADRNNFRRIWTNIRRNSELWCRYVLNPATRWLARLPPCPPPPMEIKRTFQSEYLAYDPADSPYYEVVSVTRFHFVHKPRHCFYESSRDTLDPEIEQSEWPPLVCILNVFSSRTGQWEERSFAREGDSIGTVSGMRISLSSDKYHVIKPPLGIEVKRGPEFYLGKSSKGIYCASIKGCRVQVWNLIESGYQMEWVLKHDRDISKWFSKHKLEYSRPCANYGRKIQGP
ncbi:unnamed protein product [Miscanthus lutarioriparius]|uniref:F-box domain-containing protein n=1 Tax=Miscanthus lutarioriparius TaxID=422564 RepID=A0A811N1D2_9POAL|nr:unnamed protein product [Miscanthus lutarioriparius]